ncbi:MAG: hypothetical protein M1510_03005 [Nitrospirae bacterium]|nr:hypothetical protein [Nitrospirota bacterium]MCL5238831.1 hypothetical protein [Nitrospirota bacterium]
MPESSNDRKNVSKHILPASSNLLGLCFILINFIKLWKMNKKVDMVIDKFVGMSIVLFLIASVLSYMAMRTGRKAVLYERVADIVFLFGLFFVTVISLMIAFEVL